MRYISKSAERDSTMPHSLSPMPHNHAAPVMTATELNDLLHSLFPIKANRVLTVEDVGPMTARVRLHFSERNLRPGGTLAGPSLFLLADTALYIAVMAMLGPVTHAVTTNLNINFLRKPEAGDAIGVGRLLKLGKRLAVGEVAIYDASETDLVAHATGTYSIPPNPRNF